MFFTGKVFFILLWGAPCLANAMAAGAAGWGVDGRLSVYVNTDGDFKGYLDLLHNDTGISWVREGDYRGRADSYDKWRLMLDNGLRPVLVARTPNTGAARRVNNQLPEDLLGVYKKSFDQGYSNAGRVAVWELQNEPDLGFIKDLPERMVAFNKAMYLGLRDGSESAGIYTPILLSALGVTPGPWLERAALNGMFDYGDAANIHHYGVASDLTGVIAAHRAFIRRHVDLGDREWQPARRLARYEAGWRPVRAGANGGGHLNVRRPALPIWITESGDNPITRGDPDNAERRAEQSAFIVETALRARGEPDVAVFMPFVLVHRGDGYALTESPTKHYAGWTNYAQLTRELPWPDRELTRPPRDPSRLILQWLPDAPQRVEGGSDRGLGTAGAAARRAAVGTKGQGGGTAVAPVRTYKLGGTYRFEAGESISGAVRLYNLSDVERRGSVSWQAAAQGAKGPALSAVKVSSVGGLPESALSPATASPPFPAATPLPFTGGSSAAAPSSSVVIPPMGMVEVPVVFTPVSAEGYFREQWRAIFTPTDGGRETWPVVFGLERVPCVEDFDLIPLAVSPAPSAEWTGEAVTGEVVSSSLGPWRARNGLEILAASGDDAEVTVRLPVKQAHPLRPPSLAVSLDGLPKQGFLRVTADQPFSGGRRVRVNLFDDRGQRYTLWENGGQDYFGDESEMWMSLEDFHSFSWGRASADMSFDPTRVRELMLRFYLRDPADAMTVKVELATPRR